LQVPEHLPGVELDAERAVKTLDLAGRGRRARLGEQVVDPVLTTDAVEEHLHRGLGESAGKDLAVVGQDLSWNAVDPHRGTESLANRLRPLSSHQPGRD